MCTRRPRPQASSSILLSYLFIMYTSLHVHVLLLLLASLIPTANPLAMHYAEDRLDRRARHSHSHSTKKSLEADLIDALTVTVNVLSHDGEPKGKAKARLQSDILYTGLNRIASSPFQPTLSPALSPTSMLLRKGKHPLHSNN